MTAAAWTARERQLDWLLGEVLSGVTATSVRSALRAVPDARRHRWLAAALVTLAVAVAFGVALLRQEPAPPPVQQPQEPTWHEIHGGKALDSAPADARALRCFDFDDAALARLPKFTRLERLDLSGMDVNEQGYSMAPQFTDAGLVHLGKLANLRWLSLASCDKWQGPGLTSLEQLPLLEHLDLTYTCVDSAAIERLPRLPSLRELSLSWCMHFHGRSLAEVAKIPGLRRLELRGCTTLAAADVMHLARLPGLRHLDLRDCQGRFRGQTMGFDDFGGKEPAERPEPPKQDGIGITDASVAALGKLKLEAFLLGGSESLSDAIAPTLALMATLRTLDVSNLPKTTGALLEHVPPGLQALNLDEHAHLDGAALRRLPPLPGLRELGLSGLVKLTNDDLKALLQGKTLQVLRLGAPAARGKGEEPAVTMALTAASAPTIASQRALRSLDLSNTKWLDAAAMKAIAGLPELTELDLTGATVTNDVIAPLAASRSLRSLKLVWCRLLDAAALQALCGARLEQLDLYGTNLKPAAIRELAKAWPGCTIRLPDARRYVVPQ